MDTYVQLHLVQQDSAVQGSISYCGALRGCTLAFAVNGDLSFPHVVLHWTEENGQTYSVTFDATVTAANDTLAGTIAVNEQPPGPTTYFARTAAR